MSALSSAAERLENVLASRLRRKIAQRQAPRPIVSFTFDDFPRSAATVAGKMLSEYGVRGTYYAALGLMGTATIVGEMFNRSDLEKLVADGHELACHTFGHVLSNRVMCSELLANCRDNQMRIAEMLGGYRFENFSFPEGVVTVSAKAALSSVYRTCRTIEPGVNRDPVDLGFLRANRVYSRWGAAAPKEMVRKSLEEKAWTILYTHDVCDTPSAYGCTPAEFRDVLEYALGSGAEILTVAEAEKRFNGLAARN